jgi:divalent metal cation (Fe/Co/Zn/Cd) transporter
MKVAKERKSSVLESNAIHHRVDSLTGIAALLSIALSNVFPTFSGADAFGGLVISFMVIRAGWGNTWTALSELADASFDTAVKNKVHRAATNAVVDGFPGHAVEVRGIQGTKAGQNYIIEVEIAVPHDWPVGKTRAVEEAVRTRVGEKVRGARRVRVRFIPDKLHEQAFGEEFISPSVSARSSPEPEEEHHHHSSNHNNEHATNQQNGNYVKRRK